MKTILKLVLFLMAYTSLPFLPVAYGQGNVTVNAQIIDSDGQQWFGGSWKIVLVVPPPGTYYNKATGQSFAFPANYGGTLDGTGSFSQALMPVSNILPAGTTWQFTVCPQVYSATCGTVNIPVNASGSVSTQINAVITAPRVTGGPGVYAYSDIEVSAFPNNSYFNVTSQTNRCYSTSWGTCSSGGGGGPPSGPAGGVLGGNYPNPGFASTGAIPNGWTATTQGLGDNSTQVATDAFVLANGGGGGGEPSGPAGGVLSGTYPSPGLSPSLVLPALTQATTQTPGDNTTKVATDAFVLANVTGAPSGPAGGALSGSYPNPQLAWKVVIIDNVNGAGIGVAPTAWVSSTSYPWCQVVSRSGANYIEENTAGDSVTTPGTNSSIWYPITNGARPTKADCAFYYAAASISSGTGTTTNGNGAALIAGVGLYALGIGFHEPTVTSPGNPTVSIFGQGPQVTVFQSGNNNGDGFPPLYQTPSTINFDLARLTWQGFTIDANEDAPAVVGLYGCQQCVINDIDIYNAALGNDHYMEIGAAGNMAWVYELSMKNVQVGHNGLGGGSGATFSTVVTGGTPVVTVSTGGSGYNVNWPPTPVLIQPGGSVCSGTNTLTYSGGAITGWTTTATGCNASTVASVYPGPNVSYGFKFTNMSDSHDIQGLTCDGVGSVDCLYISNVTSFNSFTKVHPIGTMDGIQSNGRNDFFATQIDTIIRRGFDFESGFGTENVYGSLFEYGSGNPGAGDYYFGAISNPPTSSPYAINLFGDMCGAVPSQANYYHFGEGAGTIDGSSLGMPSQVHVHETNYCSQITNAITNAPDYVGLQYNWSPGAWGNVFQFNMNPTAGGTAQMTVDNPLTTTGSNIGSYIWDWGNATAATNSLNTKSPQTGVCAAYWNGSSSIPSCANMQLTFASGSNPLATASFTAGGTLPSGGFQWSFDHPVILPTGSTAVTQTAGDNTTKVATDAFVLANVGSTVWSGLLSPTGALSLSMQAFQSVFTYNAATGSSDLFKLVDTTNNTGTGIMAHFTTAVGSTEIPWQADSSGTGWYISPNGALTSTDAVRNAAQTFQPGSGGAATCPTPVAGSSFLCTNAADGISYSNNGAAYTPLNGQAIPFTITASSTPAINITNGSVQTITLNANATATVSGITSGISLTMQICQPASGGPYTWAWPAGIHGGLTIGTTASDCSMQEFRSFNGTTLVAINAGVINVAP